jgi:four helix bundle protein
VGKQYNLEDRLIQFACKCIGVIELLPNTLASNTLAKQLVRSSTSPALNYGEAQGVASKADFSHKMGIVLKELRESTNCLRIINKKPILIDAELDITLKEGSELVAIFTKSIETNKKGNFKK